LVKPSRSLWRRLTGPQLRRHGKRWRIIAVMK
ncbi:MAG: hypothetical protein ACI89J_004191, partial [Hyphomicrobiaceae bacterium]